MIITEMVDERVHSYSDQGMKLRQVETGILYDDAVDVAGLYTYEETDEPIESEEISDSEALDILLGRDVNEQT